MTATTQNTLAQAFGVTEGRSARLKETGLVIAGVALLILSAKIRVPMWPVPMTFQTFAALTLGAAYGLRLGLLTNVIYLALGALGLAVFTGEGAGLAYLAGPTGGYLVGFAAAAALTGWLAERGWSRTVSLMVASLVLGNLVIYACGLGWMSVLFAADQGFGWVLANGLVPFLPGDILKVALAALLVPAVWRMAR